MVLEAGDLERVLKAVEKVRDSACEYTVEAGRPDVFTEEKLALLKEYGVTRICVNPQSFSDKTLERIGRRHTAADLYALSTWRRNSVLKSTPISSRD